MDSSEEHRHLCECKWFAKKRAKEEVTKKISGSMGWQEWLEMVGRVRGKGKSDKERDGIMEKIKLDSQEFYLDECANYKNKGKQHARV